MTAYQKRRYHWLKTHILTEKQKRELEFLEKVIETEAKMRPGPPENKMMTMPQEDKNGADSPIR